MPFLTSDISDIAIFSRIDRLNRLLTDQTVKAGTIPLVLEGTPHTMFMPYPTTRSRCELALALHV